MRDLASDSVRHLDAMRTAPFWLLADQVTSILLEQSVFAPLRLLEGGQEVEEEVAPVGLRPASVSRPLVLHPPQISATLWRLAMLGMCLWWVHIQQHKRVPPMYFARHLVPRHNGIAVKCWTPLGVGIQPLKMETWGNQWL
jgi:hypothetical protein